MTGDRWIVTVFAVYTIAYELLVWVGGMYVIIVFNWSPWWVLFLLLLSGSQLKMKHFRNDPLDVEEVANER